MIFYINSYETYDDPQFCSVKSVDATIFAIFLNLRRSFSENFLSTNEL